MKKPLPSPSARRRVAGTRARVLQPTSASFQVASPSASRTARFVPSAPWSKISQDDKHDKAARILSNAQRRGQGFVTSDYVLDETATLLGARGYPHLVEPFLQSTLRSRACSVEWTGPEEFSRSAAFLIKHIDQGWSFTDCVSFQIMKSRRLKQALTKDAHFEKAGFTALLR